MKEEFDKLIYDFLSGSIAKEDLHKLNEWIYSDPENQKYFEQQKRIWLLSADDKNLSFSVAVIPSNNGILDIISIVFSDFCFAFIKFTPL